MRRLLVANRAEIASRVFRSAKSLGISTVAICSEADSGLPYVRDADTVVRLAGNSPAETYLDVEAVLAAARSAGADAVHPGYGFLSENAGFARACAAAGLCFVGPPAAAIEAMASKLHAKKLMAQHGVPVLPGAPVATADDVLKLAETAGWPLLLKAAAGGGGRGMRRLDGPEDVEAALSSTSREAESAFGDGTLFGERLVLNPRHIEVQILGDTHGTVVSLFERECSIQRRFQKVIEECPSPAVGEELRSRLSEAALRAARAIGYFGAGTVEFVADGDGFYFLEVNTRLQVEHPVTEAVTGLDLVALQLRIADGEPLPPEVIDATIKGHAIEARLYAEDVAAGFRPVAGRLHRFEIGDVTGGGGLAQPSAGSGTRIRVDSGYESGSTVSPYYDAMLGKVIAWAPDRTTAARKLSSVLAVARIHGLVTNRDLLVGVLRHPEFLAGATDTGFLIRHNPATLAATTGLGDRSRALAVHAASAAVIAQAGRRASAPVQPHIPSGWRNVRDLPQSVAYDVSGYKVGVSYVIAPDGSAEANVRHITGSGGDGDGDGDSGGVPEARADVGAFVESGIESDKSLITLHVAAPGIAEVDVDGVRLRAFVDHHADDRWYVDSPLGHCVLTELARFPGTQSHAAAGSLVSPMPGVVTRIVAAIGDEVRKGTVLMYLEAMKMEHPVVAPADGVVAGIEVSLGAQVEAGALLAVVESPNPGPA